MNKFDIILRNVYRFSKPVPWKLGYAMEYHDMDFFIPIFTFQPNGRFPWSPRTIRVTCRVPSEIININEYLSENNQYDFSLALSNSAKDQDFLDEVREAAIYFSEPRWILAINGMKK